MKVTNIDYENKKATVELFGKVRELNFILFREWIMIFGLAVRYSHGEKIWHGQIEYNPQTGKFSQLSTPMDHRSRWASVSLVGFYEDVPEQYRSKR